LRKQQYASLALLTFLCLFGLTVASGSAMVINQSSATIVNQGNNVSGGEVQYHTSMTAVKFERYAGSGFLYNTVAELRTAYDLNPLYAAGYDGSGKTVVIVDAFGSPTIYDDLLYFIQWQNSHGANLPWTTPEEVQAHLHIYYPQGQPTFNPNDEEQVGWSQEVTLDVDMVHAIAPGANIALVVAVNSNNDVMDRAVNYAIAHHLGCAISQSWGSPEYELTTHSDLVEVMHAHNMYMSAARAGITVFASTGDWGATNGDPSNNALYPASDPYVTGVGGTNLFMVCTNATYKYLEGTGNWVHRPVQPTTCTGTSYFYEIAGNDYEGMVADGYPAPFDFVTTGGAMSRFFSIPWWQYGITLTLADGTRYHPTGRCTSDVSFDSGVYGGLGAVAYTASEEYAGYYIIGGTSAGSPFWAALTAIGCQYAHHNLGYINPMLYMFKNFLYHAKAFHDITLGDNTYPTGYPVIGYEATRGWDAPTGIGSPDAANLVPLMVWW
jgi:subtilase family serine protease